MNSRGRQLVCEIVVPVLRFPKTCALFLMGFLAASLLAIYLTPPIYESSATFLVKRARADSALAPTTTNVNLVNEVSREDLYSEMEILKSRELLEALVVAIKALPPFEGAEIDDLRRTTKKSLDFELIAGSNVLQIRFRDAEPEVAALVLREFCEAYLDRRTEILESTEAASFFEEQLSLARQRAETSTNRLQERAREAGLTLLTGLDSSDPLAKRKELTLEMLAQQEGLLAEAIVAASASAERVRSLREQLAREPERQASAHRLSMSPEVEELERALTTLELQRDELLQRYAPKSVKVRSIDDQIHLARERLSAEESRMNTLAGTEISQPYQALKIELQSLVAELAAKERRELALRDAVARSRGEYQNLSAESLILSRLQQEVDAARESIKLLQRKREETRISMAMDQQGMVNVTMISEANIPATPASPSIALLAVAMVVIGSLATLVIAQLRQATDRTVSSTQSLERALEIPSLASIRSAV